MPERIAIVLAIPFVILVVVTFSRGIKDTSKIVRSTYEQITMKTKQGNPVGDQSEKEDNVYRPRVKNKLKSK